LDDTHTKLKIVYTPAEGAEVEVSGGATLATIPFTPNRDAVDTAAVFSVSDNALVTVSGNKDATITATPGSDLTVTIEAAEAEDVTFDTEYEGLPDDYTLLKYAISEADAAYVWTYGGKAMHNIKVGENHYATYIVADTVNEGTAATPVKTGTTYEVSYDVGGNGETNIGDLQLVYDVANAHANYADLDGLDISARLAADVNGDGEVNADDAEALIDQILGR
jgi:hypothetical protein